MNRYTDTEIKELITDEAIECYEKCRDYFGVSLDNLYVEFNLRGRVAGKADIRYNTVTYNLDIARKNLNDFLNDTVGHEVSHLIAHKLNRYCKSHGIEWKTVMVFLGQKPNRCHNFEYQDARKTVKIPYICDCNAIHLIGKNRDMKIQLGVAKYRCTSCKSYIRK